MNTVISDDTNAVEIIGTEAGELYSPIYGTAEESVFESYKGMMQKQRLVTVDFSLDADGNYIIEGKPSVQVAKPVTWNINQRIGSLSISSRWKEENIDPPNINAKELAQNVAVQLFNNYELIPMKILPSVEGGITLFYKSIVNSAIVLIVEIYNDLEIATLVNDDREKKIITSTMIHNHDFQKIHTDYIAASR